MRKGVVVLALSLLALAGCASEDAVPAAPAAAAPSAESVVVEDIETGPCGIRELVPTCTTKLTDVVKAGWAAFDALENPTQEQVEADIALDHGAEAWSQKCREEPTYMVGDIYVVQGCLEAMEKIASGARVLGVL